ncbi:Isoleucine--tRNA ligase [bacterium HR21]|nr:Isoleucine--tRNA ligase [bacterium HR21]
MWLEQLPEQPHYPELEQQVLQFWEQERIFERSLQQRQHAPRFRFYEGPPTVNGKPGIHHVMARTIKDMVCRYKTMCGYYVRRQAGWDCHGLPIELAVEQQLGIANKREIETRYGIEHFNRACKELVWHHIEMEGGWRSLTRRMGYWIDMDGAYITCSNQYIESLWWALKQLFDRGLIYRGFKVVPQSPTIETPLSSHELALGYKEVRDPSVFLRVRILQPSHPGLEGAAFLVWTTTPWTLFGNAALAVHPEIPYVRVRNRRTLDGEEHIEELVLAEARLAVLEGDSVVLQRFSGAELVGTVYEQIFPDIPIDREQYPHALTVLPAEFVSTEEGTGVVHIAPAFGVEDFELGKQYGLPLLQPVTPDGHFTEEIREFAGRAIKTFRYNDRVEEGADREIVAALRRMGKLYRATFDYVHTYPHCWRTGNPVMYYARQSWFLRSPAYRERMLELNEQIRWQPPEIGAGRFGNWLREVKEWALSRDRYWGTPLPIWISEDGTEMFAIGSIAELLQGLYEFPDGRRVPLPEALQQGVELDLHRPFVDRVVFVRQGKLFRRTPEVVDVWFDSGAMPFAQFHYPFENRELFAEQFPADFIAEGVDQTRGWFYTLHNLATVLFDQPAFRSVVVNELILDKHGVKMSKSKGNVVDPFAVIERYGADAVRWYLLAANPPWKPMLFNEEEIERTVVANFLRALTNVYNFFALYARIDGFSGTEPEVPVTERPDIDRWVLSRLHSVALQYRQAMEAYELTEAVRLLQDFVLEDVSNWYVRRNRRRFWKGEHDRDKLAAYQTLYTVLRGICTMMAPAAPFLAEVLYQRLRRPEEPLSVHLLDMLEPQLELRQPELERRMELARQIASLVRRLRERARIKTRQPLRRILIPALPGQQREIRSVERLILDEVNVKSIEFLPPEVEVVSWSAKPNYRKLGKQLGKRMAHLERLLASLSQDELRRFHETGRLVVQLEGELLELGPDDIELRSQEIEGWLVASEGEITVALDTTLDEELRREGLVREFVFWVQNLRKQAGLEVTDRIRIVCSAPPELQQAVEALRDYVQRETLAESLIFAPCPSGQPVEVNGYRATICVERLSTSQSDKGA